MAGVVSLEHRRMTAKSRNALRKALHESDRAGIRALMEADHISPEKHQEVYNRARENALADALNVSIYDE